MNSFYVHIPQRKPKTDICQVRNYVIKWVHTNKGQSLPCASLLKAIMNVENKLTPSSIIKLKTHFWRDIAPIWDHILKTIFLTSIPHTSGFAYLWKWGKT